jgi:hypothetical protein
MKRLVAIFVLFVLLLPAQAFAQGQLALSSVEVALWPEFDRPTMLVIYRATLSAQATLPAELRIRIPKAAGIPNAVAARQPDGNLITIPYTQEDAGEWSTLVFKATTPDFQIEYYDPGLQKDGQARHFEYAWPGDYAVEMFKVEVQQPVGANDMRITPGMVTSRPGDDGLVYFNLDVGSLQANQPFNITVDYQKDGDNLSSGSVPVAPSGPIASTTPGSLSLSSLLPAILVVLGLALIAGGGYWYWKSGRQAAQPKKARRSRGKAGGMEAESGGAPEGSHVYCHQCGKRAAAGDRFCRACGAELRRG